jgi:hypothetical protein
MKEASGSSETSVLTRATRRTIPVYGILKLKQFKVDCVHQFSGCYPLENLQPPSPQRRPLHVTVQPSYKHVTLTQLHAFNIPACKNKLFGASAKDAVPRAFRYKSGLQLRRSLAASASDSTWKIHDCNNCLHRCRCRWRSWFIPWSIQSTSRYSTMFRSRRGREERRNRGTAPVLAWDRQLHRKIWGFHGGDYAEWCLLGCYAVWLLVFLRSVRRLLVAASVVPSSPILATLMK